MPVSKSSSSATAKTPSENDESRRRRGNLLRPEPKPRNPANLLAAAIARGDAAAVLQSMTQHRPTFTTRDLRRVITRHLRNPAAREQFTREILAHPDAVPLTLDVTAPRYTSKAILEAEQEILSHAARMAHIRQHAVSASLRAFVLKRRFQTITEEQARAVRHATGAEALALIDGQAGTGKTYVMQAVREIHERQGYEVVGLAPTNAVARTMRDDGFTDARTLHSELWALDHHRARWTRRTVVMVDESAMIDSRNLARIFAHAQASGAKLILTGDDRQLASIEPGGMFSVLKARFGAATLTEVFRQQKAKDRRASELMAEGNFHDALESYQSAIHWTDTADEAMTALTDQWAEDTAADPARSRFVFAYTNRDVNRLNAALHRIREERGELGPSWRFDTKHGAAAFATGDRLQFTETDKPQGIFNSELGTIAAIDGSTLTVALDGPGQQLVTFDADTFRGFRHGYAGTIYKGQGRTIGQSYLFHSEHWRAAPSYVALTRHRHNTALFVARETAADIDELSRQMARADDNRAASSFQQAEPAKDQSPDSTSLPPPVLPARSSFAQIIKQQFQAVAKAISSAPPAEPAAPKKKKREEETRGGFIIAARGVVSAVRRMRQEFRDAKAGLSEQMPVTAATPTVPYYAAATAYLSDTLDWLNLWGENDGNGLEDDFQHAPQEHLYPHL